MDLTEKQYVPYVKVEDLVKIVMDNKLDYLEYHGIKIQKSNHAAPINLDDFKTVKLTPDEKKKQEDEILFHSSDSPY